MEERRKNDALMLGQIRELGKIVSELSANVRVQTVTLDQHKELLHVHLGAVEKEHAALKKIVFDNISELGTLETNMYKRFAKEDARVKKIESRLDKAEGMATFAKVMWGVGVSLLGGLIWLLTKVGILS